MGLIKAYKGQLRRAVERKLAIPGEGQGVTRGDQGVARRSDEELFGDQDPRLMPNPCFTISGEKLSRVRRPSSRPVDRKSVV